MVKLTIHFNNINLDFCKVNCQLSRQLAWNVGDLFCKEDIMQITSEMLQHLFKE